MKKAYVAPQVEVAGTVAGLTRGSTHGDCPDFTNPSGRMPNVPCRPGQDPGPGLS